MKFDKEKITNAFVDFLEKHFGGSQEGEEHAVVESETHVVKSLDEMERRALFVVLEPQNDVQDVSDLHGDYYDAETVQKACRSFNKHSMKAGLYHEFTVDNELAEIEESFITLHDFETEDGRLIKKGTWLQWWHFPEPLDKEDDLIWPDVLSGEFTGVSVECAGRGYELND